MRLFGVVDGTVDRKDRAQWMTPVFDLAFVVAEPVVTPAARIYVVPAERRIYTVATENRTYEVGG